MQNRLWPELPPELTERIVAHLSPNEVACTVRPLCKAAASQFRGPKFTTVRLSQPIPPHALGHYWSREDAAWRHSLKERRQLLNTTAASGHIPNLQLALTRVEVQPNTQLLAAAAGARERGACAWLHMAGCRWSETVIQAAASTGDVEFCSWLVAQGCPYDERALAAAARGGHLPLCVWLLDSGCPWHISAPRAAAENGHVTLLEWLLDQQPPDVDAPVSLLLASAALGCDLATLQRLFDRYRERLNPAPPAANPDGADHGGAAGANGGPPAAIHEPPFFLQPFGTLSWSEQRIMAGALSSRTPDWQAKVLWLLSRGYSLAVDCLGRAAGQPSDWLDHLAWLREQGLMLDSRMAVAAARSGRVEAFEYLVGEGGMALSEDMERYLVQEAVRHGRLPMLKVLHARGLLTAANAERDLGSRCVQIAACRGHADMVRWLVDTLGAMPEGLQSDADAGAAAGGAGEEVGGGGRVVLTADVATAAAGSGNLELLVWLRQRGCPWDAATFAAASEWGSQEMLEWMAAEGCPMGDKGEPYVRAGRTSDLATLRCLRRLGCPFSPTGATFTRAVGYGCGLPVLRWLHAQGCPVDWARAVKEARHGWRKECEVLEWVRAQRRAAGLIGGGYLWRPRGGAAAWCERLLEAASARLRRLHRLLAGATAAATAAAARGAP
ncbi:hypothetical protein GPECTOR_46g287 [Gonium pectorale]|uniref:Uncharacterized protein n=1 Tax=Gonium pectorale TaxID=33097 RepID=A0A150G8R7_GONPE|nr:hypothetical protein GPECTOR_46g287 [Gonium pectorale]|eukprot:KXZ46218.1 hypothetical protein GPECTOR_46g287 [Gonium pectorale]